MPEIKIAELGELWVDLPGIGIRVGQRLGELGELLGPVAALRLIGPSEALFEQAEQLKIVALCNHGFPVRQLWTEEDRNDTEGRLDRLGGRLNFCYKRALEAEKILAAAGWKFNPKTRKAARIRGGRGRDLLRECVWVIYAGKYREEYGTASLLKKLSVRRKIAKELLPYFDAMELSPKSGALIDYVIRKGETRSR
jgi:hypothetical protein